MVSVLSLLVFLDLPLLTLPFLLTLSADTPQETVDAIISDLTGAGFHCYETSVGGPGVGISLLKNNEWNATTLCKATRSELEAVSEWRWM
jgi:hypothetical protein